MKIAGLIAGFILAGFITMAQDSALDTHFEKSGGLATPRYRETVAYCQKLDAASPRITYTTFGKSPQGRDLPLLIADKNGNATVESVRRSGNLVVLVQACIHAGEPDGKDAGLMLLRDIAVRNLYPDLLDHVTLLFIPVFNVDGHERFGPFNRINQNGPEEMGWRTTAQNLNLNRDYMKADAPEMRAWLALYNKWLPDFFVDCHVTDGADYQYVLTYALETHGTMEKQLSGWTAGVAEPFLVSSMEKAGYPIFPYVEFREWHDPRSGLSVGAAPPMLSQGYCAAQNRPGLLIESHMLKPYKQRVEGTYHMLALLLELLNREHDSLETLIRSADSYTGSKAFRDEPFPVIFSDSYADSVMVDFKGVEYSVDTSDLTGGLWFQYDNTKPVTWQIPMFPNPRPDRMVMLPEAYLIPPEWSELVQILKLHGVECTQLKEDCKAEVSVYRFSDAKWQQRPYEGRHKVTFTVSDSMETKAFPAGSFLVSMNQRTAKVIAHLLEPLSPDSFVSWGFMDAVFEQKEYFETYVMEPMARKMMAENPNLKEEFDQWKKSQPEASGDPYAQLAWFHSRTPWKDGRQNVYPVGRIMDDRQPGKLR